MLPQKYYFDSLSKYEDHAKRFGPPSKWKLKVDDLKDVASKQCKYISENEVSLIKSKEALTKKMRIPSKFIVKFKILKREPSVKYVRPRTAQRVLLS